MLSLHAKKQHAELWLETFTSHNLFTLKKILLPKAELSQILRNNVITQGQRSGRDWKLPCRTLWQIVPNRWVSLVGTLSVYLVKFTDFVRNLSDIFLSVHAL